MRKTRTLILGVTAALALGALAEAAPRFVPGGAPGDVQVRFRERIYALDELPAEMGEKAADAIAAWSGWADEHGYRLDLEDEGRVLLISPGKSGGWRAQMRLVDRTIKRFDAALPAPPRAPKPAAPMSGPKPPGPAPLPEDPGDGPLPEDPEGRPPGVGGGGGQDGPIVERWSSVWGAETIEPDTETIVFFVVRNDGELRELVARLAQDHPYLADWAAEAVRFTGFTLEQPLAGAYVASAAGQEEWNPDNELVHRLAELLLIRRFGQAPFWMVQGFAWHLEEGLLGSIYCFPYRSEFVYATEHTAWPGELQHEFADRDDPLAIEELAFPRGAFDGARARRAFGAARFLVAHRPGKLGAALEALRLFRDETNRNDHGDGTWSRERFYAVPLADQARLMREQIGDDVFAEMAKGFRLGKAYGR